MTRTRIGIHSPAGLAPAGKTWRRLAAAACCAASLGFAAPSAAVTVVYDGGTGFATGILDLLVGATAYDVEFVGGSYDAVYAVDAPTFFGDETSADAAANAIMAAMNAEPSVPTISAFDAEILWVPYALPDATSFRTEQVGHDTSADPWQRYADFVGPRSTDWPAEDRGWYFTRFTPTVPEPLTALLVGAGLLGIGATRRRPAAR